jgi:hypothetical protein
MVRAADRGRAESVLIVAASELCSLLGVVPRLVKIDVEGAEPEVVAGLRPLLGARPLDVVLEFGPERLRRLGTHPQSFLDHLSGTFRSVQRVAPAPEPYGLEPVLGRPRSHHRNFTAASHARVHEDRLAGLLTAGQEHAVTGLLATTGFAEQVVQRFPEDAARLESLARAAHQRHQDELHCGRGPRPRRAAGHGALGRWEAEPARRRATHRRPESGIRARAIGRAGRRLVLSPVRSALGWEERQRWGWPARQVAGLPAERPSPTCPSPCSRLPGRAGPARPLR